jgi:protein phosphatase PTC6
MRCRHGGSTVSQYLRQELHGLLESVDKSHIPEMYEYIKEIGGYFKRFQGGLLSSWINPSSRDVGEMDLHTRATLTFFEVSIFSHSWNLQIFSGNEPDYNQL